MGLSPRALQLSRSLPSNTTLECVLFLAGAQPASPSRCREMDGAWKMDRWKRWKKMDGGRGAYRERLHPCKASLQRSALSRNRAIVDVICLSELGPSPPDRHSTVEASLMQPITAALFVAYSITTASLHSGSWLTAQQDEKDRSSFNCNFNFQQSECEASDG